jgi:hypothetical protein
MPLFKNLSEERKKDEFIDNQASSSKKLRFKSLNDDASNFSQFRGFQGKIRRLRKEIKLAKDDL